MKIISPHNLPSGISDTVLTMGMFDGVHRGHRQIIDQINSLAEKHGLESCLLTFWPHPRMVLQQDSDISLLTTQEEKMQQLAETGLSNVYVKEFDREFAGLSSEQFVRDFLVQKLQVKILVIGHDHHFGKNREGDFAALQQLSNQYNFEVIQLEAIVEDDRPISSTKIRKALIQADLDYANEALGYRYLITGNVIHGDKIGRTMGYPTVNLQIESYKLLPMDGVYGVRIHLNNEPHYGLMNIGNRPTFSGMEKRVEVYILDYDGDLYEQKIQVELCRRIRNEMKFESKEALSAQIQQDEIEFRNFLKNQA